MVDYQPIIEFSSNAQNGQKKIGAKIIEDVSEERIKCTDFEGFTPTG